MVLLALFLAGIAIRSKPHSSLGPQVTLSRVNSIGIGQGEADVVAKLGAVVERRKRSDGSEVLEFARQTCAREHPTVSVVMRDGGVAAVFVEVQRLWGADEDTLYLRTAERVVVLPELKNWLPGP